MARRRAGGRYRLGALLASLLALALPFMAAGCLNQAAAGPPLTVLGTIPQDGGYLSHGGVVVFEFNFPVDPAEFAEHLKVSPSCELEIRARDTTLEIAPLGAVPGKAYRFEVMAGLAGVAGRTLERGRTVTIVALPAGMEPPAVPGEPEGLPSTWPVTGCELELEGAVVAGCDLPGAYTVPRFDLVRLFWPGGAGVSGHPHVTVFALEANQTMRALPVAVTEKAGYTEVCIKEQVRAGEDYLVAVGDSTAQGGEPATDLWRLSVKGSPYLQVWSVNVRTGKTSPVGQVDLGYELRMLLPGPGESLYAVGTPGGLAWTGLEVVQPLDRSLNQAGKSVAVFRETNVLGRQVDASSGTLVAVAPASGVPDLPGGGRWTGSMPASPSDADRSGQLEAGGPPGTAIIAVRGDKLHTLMWDPGNPGEFPSGPALSPGLDAVSFSTTGFGSDVTVGVWRIALPQSWTERQSVAADVFPVRIAHNTYERAFTGGYLYTSGTAWAATGEIWWDIYVDEGTAELWRLDPRVTSRELISTSAGTPLVSPDGRHALCRLPAGVVLVSAAGDEQETVMGTFDGATWLPDSSGVLLVGGEGITLLPVAGRTVRIVSFPARPGVFVGPEEYWFVSDRPR